MKLRQLPNGNLMIPVGIYFDEIDGDGYEEITPDDPRYAEWVTFLGTEWDASYSGELIVEEAEPARPR